MSFVDYTEITRRVYDYAFFTDTEDYEQLRSLFTDEITMDFEDTIGRPKTVLRADDWVAGAKVLFTGLDASQHVMSNPVVEVDGDTATCRVYMQAQHFFGEDGWSIGGYYVDTLERIDGRWLISGVTLKQFWSRGNQGITALAAQKGAAILAD